MVAVRVGLWHEECRLHEDLYKDAAHTCMPDLAYTLMVMGGGWWVVGVGGGWVGGR